MSVSTKTKLPNLSLNGLKGLSLRQVFPWLLMITAAIGLGASFILMLEHLALLKDPGRQLTCSLNPIINCGPVMQSPTASQFGFPNPLLGIATFSAQALLGAALLAGARFKTWFWQLWGVVVAASVAFMLYLMYQSFFVIGAICVYCLTVWLVLSISAWYTLQYVLAEGIWKIANRRFEQFVRRRHGDLLLGWFLLVAAVVLAKFWYYYGPRLGF